MNISFTSPDWAIKAKGFCKGNFNNTMAFEIQSATIMLM